MISPALLVLLEEITGGLPDEPEAPTEVAAEIEADLANLDAIEAGQQRIAKIFRELLALPRVSIPEPVS
jgi:hypothetical protein